MASRTFHPGPTVVFIDDAPWECFFHLAAILHRARVRTVRISVGLSGWQSDQILFDRHVALSSPPTPEHLARILSTEYVTDVHPTESLAVTTYAALDLLPPAQRSDIWAGRNIILDKWRFAEDLRDLGLRVPDTLLAEFTTPAEAVAQLSLPLVVKRRVSSPGSSVEVFNTLETLENFVATIERRGDWFFERFVTGSSLVCASFVGDEGVDVITSYEIIDRANLHGTSIVVRMLDDTRLENSGRLLIDEFHIRGMVCLDVIRDADGVDWIHDVNRRVFAGASMCQLMGFDFYGAYVRWLLGRGRVEPSPFDTVGERAFVFPFGWKEVFRSGSRTTAGARSFVWAWRNTKMLGARYLLSLAIRGFTASVEKVADGSR